MPREWTWRHERLTATSRQVFGRTYVRIAVRTPWLTADQDLADVLTTYLPRLRPGDTVAISEKVAALLTGHAVPLAHVQPGLLARLLARAVRPREGSRGLSVPEKMEYVLRRTGRPRVLLAAVAGGASRALGRSGDFYRIAGNLARDLDGARPPYEQLLLPPLSPLAAAQLCADLERRLGVGIAIVDLNDFGGSIRAVSDQALSMAELAAALGDNPLRQRLTGTPIAVVRPLD